MITGPGIAKLYQNHVFRWFGLPTKIISDRDPRFTSHFSKALTIRLGIKQNILMAFHPQMDGLSEWKNQWIEQYLRLITLATPKDWTQWLVLALAIHNNWRNTTIGLSPNQILLGYEITLNPRSMPLTLNELAKEQYHVMMEQRVQAIEAINQAVEKAGRPEAQYAEGMQVWLEGWNLKLSYQLTKLAPKRYGPFKIIKEVSPVVYQLNLLASWGDPWCLPCILAITLSQNNTTQTKFLSATSGVNQRGRRIWSQSNTQSLTLQAQSRPAISGQVARIPQEQ
jgi:hypothetical protein